MSSMTFGSSWGSICAPEEFSSPDFLDSVIIGFEVATGSRAWPEELGARASSCTDSLGAPLSSLDLLRRFESFSVFSGLW